MRDCVGAACEFARAGNGPVILEIITYRYRGHSMSDPAKYRKPGELEEKKKSDPLAITEQRLLGHFQVEPAKLDEIRAKVEAEAEDSVKFAEESPWPDPAHLYEFTYAPEKR